MRYTGMDVSTTMSLPKAHVRENTILTYRLKNGAEVWTVVPAVGNRQATGGAARQRSVFLLERSGQQAYTRVEMVQPASQAARPRQALAPNAAQFPASLRSGAPVARNANRGRFPLAGTRQYQRDDEILRGMDPGSPDPPRKPPAEGVEQ